ncbi:MAG: KEOPS complex kinase/ATPase Bud32 [Thermoproteota archaeon]
MKIELVKNLYLGAEAEISLCNWLGFQVVVKRRKSKGYRIKDLDRKIIATRTIHEASMLSKVRSMGVPTPFVLHIDPVDGVIVMQYLDGSALSEIATRASLSELKPLFKRLGNHLGVLHRNKIIHGDPTTSNMIVLNNEVFMVDFGLASYASGVEQMGEDLYVLDMALKSAHHPLSKELFDSVLSGYGEKFGTGFDLVLKRLGEISKRGRYVERIS